MGGLLLPRNLAEAADRDGEIRAWIPELPSVVAEMSQRWSLELDAPYQPGGRCSWVAPVRTPLGEDLVLKVGWRHIEAEHEVDALALWDGDGAVRLHATHDIADSSVMLLERCTPGTALGHALTEPEQDVVIAALLHRLWRQAPDGHRFRPLQDMCDQWAREFEQRLATPDHRVDPGLDREGMAVLRALPSSAERHVVLCTDLHAENVLAARRMPWLAVDPKPYLGDPTYDALQHMLNCPERLYTDPVALTRRMAGLLDVDPGRLQLWLFARCVQESPDDPALLEVAARIAP
ncbi:hypothetical protein J5X84_02215 [Streptosporangiaceae bacterium NEAU-GS5]|nr:hypothetical protein [Streptosporangiaceae bacterium NEAU-GS5]